MIYFDNSATSLVKPPEVAKGVAYAINNFGNAGRSFYDSSLNAYREVIKTKQKLALLVNANPENIAFTSGATESLNLVINGLVCENDHVITSYLEHNSVLRPLYNAKTQLSFIAYDVNNQLDLNSISSLVKTNTKYIIITHGSNVTGQIIDLKTLSLIAQKHDLKVIIDASQTIGIIDIDASLVDVICFTGHKALFGPQGTGGIICNSDILFKPIKVGGNLTNSFAQETPLNVPTIFEAGTFNAHSIYGLQKGLDFILEVTVTKIKIHEHKLTHYLISKLKEIPLVKLYTLDDNVLPVISFNIGKISSDEIAFALWDQYQIATRPGFHCAPLVHEHYHTQEQGMVRISLSYYNTFDEIDLFITAMHNIIKEF